MATTGGSVPPQLAFALYWFLRLLSSGYLRFATWQTDSNAFQIHSGVSIVHSALRMRLTICVSFNTYTLQVPL